MMSSVVQAAVLESGMHIVRKTQMFKVDCWQNEIHIVWKTQTFLVALVQNEMHTIRKSQMLEVALLGKRNAHNPKQQRFPPSWRPQMERGFASQKTVRSAIPTLWASADRPGNRKTHLLDRSSGKSRQKMKSAEVLLMVWSKGGLECK